MTAEAQTGITIPIHFEYRKIIGHTLMASDSAAATPHSRKRSVGELKVDANSQSRMSLGSFHQNECIDGFSVYISPRPQDDAIVSQITKTQSRDGDFELILHIANYGDVDVCAEVWYYRKAPQ
jgi:hypothetical protein